MTLNWEQIFKEFPSELNLTLYQSAKKASEWQGQAGTQLPVISRRYSGVCRELDMEPLVDADKTVIVSHFHRPAAY